MVLTVVEWGVGSGERDESIGRTGFDLLEAGVRAEGLVVGMAQMENPVHNSRLNQSKDEPADNSDNTQPTATTSAVISVSRVLNTIRVCKDW